MNPKKISIGADGSKDVEFERSKGGRNTQNLNPFIRDLLEAGFQPEEIAKLLEGAGGGSAGPTAPDQFYEKASPDLAGFLSSQELARSPLDVLDRVRGAQRIQSEETRDTNRARDLGIRSAELDVAGKMQALRKGAISQAGGGKGEIQGSVYQGQNPRDREAAMRAKEISRQLLEEQLASLRGQREAFENKAQDQDRTRDSIIPQLLRLLQGVRRSNYF